MRSPSGPSVGFFRQLCQNSRHKRWFREVLAKVRRSGHKKARRGASKGIREALLIDGG